MTLSALRETGKRYNEVDRKASLALVWLSSAPHRSRGGVNGKVPFKLGDARGGYALER